MLGSVQRARLAEFLEDAAMVYVEFRSNRLVLFNGNLFLKSMPLVVGAGFRRRINLTLLFGRRGAQCEDKLASRQTELEL